MDELISQPVIQYGFAGLSVVLLGIIVWLISRLLRALEANQEVLANNQKVIAENTAAIHELRTQSNDQLSLLRRLLEMHLKAGGPATKERG